VRADVGERGKRRRKGGEVVADRRGRIDSGTGAGRRVLRREVGRSWAESGSRPDD
jgi:hypothetical protein